MSADRLALEILAGSIFGIVAAAVTIRQTRARYYRGWKARIQQEAAANRALGKMRQR
jgi:hypothetical protein